MQFPGLLRSFLLILLSLFAITQSVMACDSSSVSLLAYTDNGTTHDYDIQVCIGGGILGSNVGATNYTTTIAISVYKLGSTVTLTEVTDSIESTETGVKMFSTVLDNVLGAEKTIAFLHLGGTEFTCISSTALCGQPHSDCFTISFTSDVFLDSLIVYGVEGAGNPIAGCYATGEMRLNLISLLPVEWSSISARQIRDEVAINWETASSTNNHYFQIERANEKGRFHPVGTVDGDGTIDQAKSYRFLDQPRQSGTYFYRVKQVDYDGQFSYSPITMAAYVPIAQQIIVRHDQVADQISIALSMADRKQLVDLEIYTQSGQLIYQEQVLPDERLDINLETFSAGLHVLAVKQGATWVDRRKFVIH